MISFLDVGLQMFGLSAKLAFPFGPNFYLSISSFCPHPALCLAGSRGAFRVPMGSWLTVSWGTGVLRLSCWLT